MMALCPSLRLRADNSVYHLDIGVQAGLGYYVGDATPHIFQDVKEVLGAQFRYKVDQRWSVQMKGQWQRIMYSVSDVEYHNPMWNLDATAEFNFFRFGMHPYDQRVKSITPFLFVGVGTTVYQEHALKATQPIEIQGKYNLNLYIPLGIGVKWMFAERWQLQAVWQHQIYVQNGDGLEGLPQLNNSHNLNGINIMNNDLVSSLTIGVVFEFWKKRDICVHCED